MLLSVLLCPPAPLKSLTFERYTNQLITTQPVLVLALCLVNIIETVHRAVPLTVGRLVHVFKSG